MSTNMKRWLTVLFVLALFSIYPILKFARGEDLLRLGLDLKGGMDILLKAVPQENVQITPELLDGAIDVIRRRLDPEGKRELFIQRRGTDRIEVQIPGVFEPERTINLIKQAAFLRIVDVGTSPVPKNTVIDEETIKKKGYTVVIEGGDIAKADTSWYNARPIVEFTLKPSAAKRFGSYTSKNIGHYLAIVIDDKVISCPVVKDAIYGGRGIIEGNFTIEEAQDLANQLNAGRLPVPFEVLSNVSVGPTLGSDSISKSLKAGIWGIVLVLIFMVLFYRLPGFLADVALIIYIYLFIAILSTFDLVLTLPGIAGFILSIGMAVDANIIIFERIKEELKVGKPILSAIESGFKNGFRAILDANVTTLITAVVLFWLGTGPIKGFAITLSLGIVLSMFSALVVTRALLDSVGRDVHSPSLYGVKGGEAK